MEFSIGFALGRVKGRFTSWRGTILYDPENPANSSITAIIETSSLDTGWPNRDRHLRTSDFFDVERYPTIRFQSTRLRRAGSGWMVEGPLTMHGVTRHMEIPFQFLPGSPVRSAESRHLNINVNGAVRLARKDFGITGGSIFNPWFTAARNATMADSVDITIELEGWMADATTHRLPAIDSAVARIRSRGIEPHLTRVHELLAARPDSQRLAYFRGQDVLVRALIASDLRPQAASLSRGLTELFPSRASAFVGYGLALAASGDTEAASRAYARARVIGRAPRFEPADTLNDDPEWWYLDQLARAAVEWRLGPAAVVLARVIRDLYPEIARAHVTLGIALAASGDAPGASAAYQDALRIDPLETSALERQRRR